MTVVSCLCSLYTCSQDAYEVIDVLIQEDFWKSNTFQDNFITLLPPVAAIQQQLLDSLEDLYYLIL